MKKVRVEQAVGMVLAHDITQIIPGVNKGPLLRKGHIVTETDIPALLKCGKEHLYLLEKQPGWLHENEGATRLARAAVGTGTGLELTDPKEGKVNIKALVNGVLKINVQKLTSINCLGEMMMATIHTNYPVRKGDVVAGTRIIPLIIEEEKVRKAESICRESDGLMTVLTYGDYKAGLIVTGSEVKKGRIKDCFGTVVEEKLAEFDVKIAARHYVGDDYKDICKIIQLLARTCDMVIVTGGMSVDPDDNTPRAIRETNAEVVTYGVPVLPGSMFMLAYIGKVPVMGLPGCVMYDHTTVFDLVLPRILTGERITSQDLAVMGHGGLCLNCPECHYPRCAFGKTGGVESAPIS